MKRLFGLLVILSVFFVGCSNDSSIFEPLVGTWKADNAIGSTVLVLNNDDTAVQTYTLVNDFGTTKSGTWSSNDDTVTRTWSSSDVDTDYYSLSSNNSVLTLSSTPNGTATVYERQ
jgi:hypothetical protein